MERRRNHMLEMGEQGPCGPCSEIHYDRIVGRDVSELVNQDDPNVIEVWNIVFMAFNHEADGSLSPLPNMLIDTGMGFERLVSILQDKKSNYIFQVPLCIEYNSSEYHSQAVIADHVRTLTFSISNGGVPSNQGRGYALRRILLADLRKFGVQIRTFFSSLVDTVLAELVSGQDEEEEAFSRTLDRGERLFDGYLQRAESKTSNLSGADFWRLYDTYGFPVDLTRLMAEENGVSLGEEEFSNQQEAPKALSGAGKGSGAGAGEVVAFDVHDLAAVEAKKDTVPKTDDFIKYQTGNVNAHVKLIYRDHAFLQDTTSIESQKSFGILLDRTNMYAEQGSQEYDTGSISVDGKAEFVVENVLVYGGYVLHTGYLKYGILQVGDEVVFQFDQGTHLLNHVLREIFWKWSRPKGIVGGTRKVRFDFTSKTGMTPQQIHETDSVVADFIKRGLAVYSQEVDLTTAKQITGLLAVFGEAKTSIEICGGTHVAKTSDIKQFVITEETGIAKDTRRIVAVTGEEAHQAEKIANKIKS
ncbi:MAG: tRNA synthetases class II (A)-domain-containing protein [Benniella sp.]|nr:MAG: tRNA synthetases class II (A)-domain-containing protein [Benniella sp.]